MGRRLDRRLASFNSATSYCRESDIYFNRNTVIPPPDSLQGLLINSYQSSSASPKDPKKSSPIITITKRDNSSLNNKFLSEDFSILEQRTYANLSLDEMQTDNAIEDFNLRIKKSCTDSDYLSNSPNDDSPSSSSSRELLKVDEMSKPKPLVDVIYARELLLAKIDKHISWSKKAAKNAEIYNIEHRQIYIYSLESFTEKRSIQWHYEPHNYKWSATYRGSSAAVNSRVKPYEPTPESIWSALPISLCNDDDPYILHQQCRIKKTATTEPKVPIKLFQPSHLTIELPNTSFVKTCHICHGRARKNCSNCNALGHEVCFVCLGKGKSNTFNCDNNRSPFSRKSLHQEDQECSLYTSREKTSYITTSTSASESCHHCHGDGKRRCINCHGSGTEKCIACDGQAKIRCFLRLVVVFQNHKKDTIINNEGERIIPNYKLRLASCRNIYEHKAPKLEPLEWLDDNNKDFSIASVSRSFLNSHKSSLQDELLIHQRHKLQAIDVDVVRYQWKDKFGQFVIYGNDRKAHIKKFPYVNCCSII